MDNFQLPVASRLIAELAGYDAARLNKPRVPAQCENWHTMVRYYTQQNPEVLGVSVPISEAWIAGYQQRIDEEASAASKE